MTLQEAVKEYQYDITICYTDAFNEEPAGWYWDINGGYSSVGGRHTYANIQDAYNELLEFLETFKPFEK
jgi:hypothetical protein